MLNLVAALVMATSAAPSPAPAAAARMNDLTAVGTHNSYKLAVPPEEMAAMVAARGNPALGLDYAHRPLAEQLDAGARQLEIDFVYDPQGGRYATPLGRKMAPDTTPYDLSTMSPPARSFCQ